MQIINKIQESNLRFIFLIIAMYFLGLTTISFYNNIISDRQRMTTDDCLWIPVDTSRNNYLMVITDIIPGGVADDAGIKDKDILVAINGERITSASHAMKILNSYNKEFIEYTILRNDELMNVNIWVYKFLNVRYLIFYAIGMGFLIVGFIVGYSSPKELTSRLFFFTSMSASIGLHLFSGINPIGISAGPSNPEYLNLLYYYLILNFLVAVVFLPVMFLHFFLTYPVKFEHRNRKLIIIGLYILNLLLYTAMIIIQRTNILNVDLIFAIIISACYYIAGIIAFRRSYSKISDSGLKKSLNIINLGFLIGGTGLLYYLAVQFLITKPVFLINPLLMLPIALVLAIPLSFGFSIFKYRILDTEFIVKRSIVFGIVTVFIIGLYMILIYLIDSYFKEFFKGNNQLLVITFIILFTFSFDYVNKYAKDFVDKQIYRERYNYRKMLLEFSEKLTYINDPGDLNKRIKEFVLDTLGIKEFSIFIFKDEYRFESKHSLCDVIKKLFNGKNAPVLINAAMINEYGISEEEYRDIKKEDIKLSIPIYIKGELIGSMNFGSKESGKAFSEEDVDLLKSFASQSSICLENTRLRTEELHKQRFEEELSIAKNIQTGLLPKADVVTEYLDISGYSEPAKVIGGDFYDIIKLDNDNYLITVADVSDKGIPAALYMSQVQAMMQFASTIFTSPKEILIEINRQIYDQLTRFSFITIIIAKFDVRNNKLMIARAGHTPLLRKRGSSTETIFTGGIGVGLDNKGKFEENIQEVELELRKGDVYLFYSDGLSEAMNKSKELYGLERITGVLDNLNDNSTQNVREKLLKSVNEYREYSEPNDDITFVVVKVK